ncbi:N-acetylmuramoyl-L-alanine amidase [Candidatus Babeliales bacterium]|nr:N-acetylmuramoyl-L-alanine amidase [Candidatus Babeliales bacterium]
MDFGHGGKDAGYSNSTVKEKEINFAVGMQLASLLKEKGHEVCLIRDKDEYIALDQRSQRALACGPADALISLHANSAGSEKVHGIETFCHRAHLFESHLNHGSFHTMSASEKHNEILYQKSNVLAKSVHEKVLTFARVQKKDLVDRKIQHKVSQVLLGADMPSILIELGFLTNNKEGQMLKSSSYQKTLANGIVNGLDDYFKLM